MSDRHYTADRILKLLDFASSTPFEKEAETARRLAGELTKKANIGPLGSNLDCRRYIPFGRGTRWELAITSSLSELTSCMITVDSDLITYDLIGTVSNLDTLEYMLESVSQQRGQAWRRYKSRGGMDSFGSFCFGFAMALRQKIGTMVNMREVNKNGDMLQRWYEENIVHAKCIRSDYLKNMRATSIAGMNAGEAATLHHGLIGYRNGGGNDR